MSNETIGELISRLLNLGFTSQELSALIGQDWPVERVMDALDQLLAEGVPAARLRDVFERDHPALFAATRGYLFTPLAAASFGEDRTRFLWNPYIPLGDYTVLMAPGGAGKTFFACAVAAAVSRGEALPGDEAPDGPGNVLLISAEDRGELLKQRLRASNAALENVYILDCSASAGLNITEGWEDFRELAALLSPRLIVLDPWHGFLGGELDINRVNAVRPLFQRLANLAKALDCALVLISHVNKRAQSENVNHAATGSTDFVNAARSALYLLADPEDEDARVVVHTKSNYARSGESVRFRINGEGGAVWDGFSEVNRAMLEEAARRRKSLGEITRSRAEAERVNEGLIDALSDAADPRAVVRFSYAEFKARYGETIFGAKQPKRALEAVADELYARGYELKAGVRVREGNATVNGFSIAGLYDSA